jgi:hypothetical protein
MVRFRKIPLIMGALALLGLLEVGANLARASPLTVTLLSVTAEGANFRWRYQIDLTADEQATAGPPADFFVVYDFQGLVGAPTVAGAAVGLWTPSSQNVGPVGPNVSPFIPDNPAIPNLVFTKIGAAQPGPVTNFGTFEAVSTLGAQQNGAFTAQSKLIATGQLVGTTSFVPVPVPEPTTMLLALAGPVFVFGAVKRGLRRRQA